MLAAQAQPSEVTYTALLSMWGKSRHPQASQRIVEVFQHMRLAGRTLDTVGYRCATPHLASPQFAVSTKILILYDDPSGVTK